MLVLFECAAGYAVFKVTMYIFEIRVKLLCTLTIFWCVKSTCSITPVNNEAEAFSVFLVGFNNK